MEAPSLGYPIPVTVLSYRLEYLLVGGSPWLYRATNLLLHLGIRPRWRWLGSLAVAVSLWLAAMASSSVWRGSVTLGHSVFARYPDSPQMCVNLGNGYFEQGRLEIALHVYEHCDHRFGPGQSSENRAITLFGLGRHAEARRLFEQHRRVTPDDPAVRKHLGLLGALP